jgi:hypothetical protein
MLGTYGVTGTLETNTCGPGLGAPSPWSFSAEMSEDGTTLYWSWMDGSPPLYNVVNAQQVTLTATDTANVDGTADGGLGPCTMVRDDTLQITLGSGSPPPAFTGSLTYTFSAASGADCTDQLGVTGGSYDTLPCSLGYTLSGTRPDAGAY